MLNFLFSVGIDLSIYFKGGESIEYGQSMELRSTSNFGDQLHKTDKVMEISLRLKSMLEGEHVGIVVLALMETCT